jgi:hypothetical protein
MLWYIRYKLITIIGLDSCITSASKWKREIGWDIAIIRSSKDLL